MPDAKSLVYLTDEDGIGVLTIDNPPLNPLSGEVVRQLEEKIRQVDQDHEIRVLIITGANDEAFVVGGDIKEFPRRFDIGPEKVQEQAQKTHVPFNLIDTLDRPVIAAINGYALGGGCELALACDIRIAEEQALIGLPEIKLGIFPGAGGTQRLPRLVGVAKAKELMFTGEPISAQEAKEIGLVNRVVGKGKALAAARELAASLAHLSLPSISRIKKCVDEGILLPLKEGLELETRYFGEVFQTEDAKEGVKAFIEKRSPRFQNM